MQEFSSLLPRWLTDSLAHRVAVFILLLCVGVLGLSSCIGNDTALPTLPTGVQTVSGLLKPAEISVARRGTHIIDQDGIDVYFAESATVNLGKYQGKRVTVRGTLEHNIDPSYLPVLVVDSILDVEETVKSYDFDGLKLSLDAPVHWITQKEGVDVQFLLKEDEQPVLTITTADAFPEGGVPIVVDAMRAVRLIDELTGNQIVAVKRTDDDILTFIFTPSHAPNPEAVREAFVQILASVSFTEEERTNSGSGTVSAPGIPCGGPAGVLCPAGYFCDVQDLVEKIGRCRKL